MSSPSLAQSPMKLGVNIGNNNTHATVPISLSRSPDTDYLNPAQPAKPIISPAKLTNLLNPSGDSSPSANEQEFQPSITSPTPLSISPNEVATPIELPEIENHHGTTDQSAAIRKHIPYQPRLLRQARKTFVTFSSDSTSPVSQVTTSTAAPPTPTQIQLSKKLYPPKRRLRGTKRSVIKAFAAQSPTDSEHIPSRKIEIKSQPVFGIRGTMAWKAKYHKKSRRKGPQPLFKRVLVKNANMIAMHRILAEKDLKPRKWKLEAVSSEDSDFDGNITYTWRPTSKRLIKSTFIPPPAPYPQQRKQVNPSITSSKPAQPHTIPVPKSLNLPKVTTNDRGMTPVVTFIDSNGNKRLQCPGENCPKHFADRCGLNRHKNRHHPEIGPLGAQLPPIQPSS